LLQQVLVSGVPEVVERADGIQICGGLRLAQRSGDNQIADLDAFSREGRRGQQYDDHYDETVSHRHDFLPTIQRAKALRK
jgi:hypothetical protein